jgi:tetraacyldisaccharide 4'-kinase
VLTIASHLYALGARVRRRTLSSSDAQRRLDRPVVSVGNLSVGGSGKTPLVAFIARLLEDAGERPAILSRGFARTRPEDGVTVVSDGIRLRADLERAGDEPLMLARTLPRVPVLVSADRYLAGRLAELRLGATVHLLDDGFQHLVLARTVNLLVLDREDIERPRMLPRGRLREPLSAVRHADALLATDPTIDRLALSVQLGVQDVFSVVRDVGPAIEDTLDGPHPVKAGSRIVVFSAIARPQRFEDEARAAGFDVAETIRFRDHHPYGPGDLARIAARMRQASATIALTTEKDLMRLLPLRPWPMRIAVRRMQVRVEPDTFGGWLLARLKDSPESRS